MASGRAMIQGLGKGRPVDAAPRNYDLVAFDGFMLDLKRGVLYQNGQRLHLRQRELDILTCLARQPNRFVSKQTLIDTVWPGQSISDANLRVQMSALRRVLGPGPDRRGFIDVLPRQGYRFCPSGKWSAAGDPDQTSASDRAAGAEPSRHNLPVRVKRSFGREYDCKHLLALLAENRLATVVGPGGIGKTTLALTTAERLVDTFEDGVRFVDLAGLTDGDFVPGSLAAAIGVVLGPDATEDILVEYLVPKRTLFVVDNCEHLIGPVAALVELILTQTRHVRFLCTSREPLRIDGEALLRLGPLDLPPRTGGLAPHQVADYPAVQLFNDRAGQGTNDFQPEGEQILTVAGLCRRLDGNPLAIELAAARLGLFGLDGLVAQLDESLSLLVQGRRTAVSRHKTLRETIDWSYNLLPPVERSLLNRLSIFRSGFSLEAARAVAGQGLAGHDLLHGLAELVAKSLINVDLSGATPQYRMLLLTREFAFEKLESDGDRDTTAQRHATYFLELMTLAAHDRSVDAEAWAADVGSAINWSLGEPGNSELACTLVQTAFNVMERYSRLADRGRLIDRALTRAGDTPETETNWKLTLYLHRLHILQFTSADEAELTAWAAKCDALAERLYLKTKDIKARLEALVNRCGMAFSIGNAPKLLELAAEGERYGLDGRCGAPDLLRFERSLFQAHHFVGDHDTAQTYVAKVLAYPDEVANGRYFAASDYISPAITARIFKARMLWIQGRPPLATEVAGEALGLSYASSPNVICYVLGFAAIPIALWRGDTAIASDGLNQLQAFAEDQGLGYWASWARLYAFALAWGRDGVGTPVSPALIRNTHQADHLATFCSAENSRAYSRVEAGLAGWNAPEVLRRRAEWTLATGAASPLQAEAVLVRAIDLARQQRAPGWELRAALSLARLRQSPEQNHAPADDAADALRRVADRFDMALPDRDIAAARAFLTGRAPS